MSSEVRQEFVKRHLLYVSAYILTWLPYLGFSYFILYATTILGPEISYTDIRTAQECKFENSLQMWFNAYNMTCIATGIFLSIIRMREPVFKRVLWRYVC